MKKLKKIAPAILVAGLLLVPVIAMGAVNIGGAENPVSGEGLTRGDVEDIIGNFANFIMTIGIALAIIAVVVGGIIFATAGDNEDRATRGKKWLWNGLIAALIIFAAGLLIDTMANIVARNFF